MKPDVKKRLEAAGWKIGSVQEFLGLSDEEMAIIGLNLDSVKPAQTEFRDDNCKVNPRAN